MFLFFLASIDSFNKNKKNIQRDPFAKFKKLVKLQILRQVNNNNRQVTKFLTVQRNQSAKEAEDTTRPPSDVQQLAVTPQRGCGASDSRPNIVTNVGSYEIVRGGPSWKRKPTNVDQSTDRESNRNKRLFGESDSPVRLDMNEGSISPAPRIATVESLSAEVDSEDVRIEPKERTIISHSVALRSLNDDPKLELNVYLKDESNVHVCPGTEKKPTSVSDIGTSTEEVTRDDAEFEEADLSNVSSDIDYLPDDRFGRCLENSRQKPSRRTANCIFSHLLILTTLFLSFFAKFSMFIFPDFSLSCESLSPLWSAYFDMFLGYINRLSHVSYPYGSPPS